MDSPCFEQDSSSICSLRAFVVPTILNLLTYKNLHTTTAAAQQQQESRQLWVFIGSTPCWVKSSTKLHKGQVGSATWLISVWVCEIMWCKNFCINARTSLFLNSNEVNIGKNRSKAIVYTLTATITVEQLYFLSTRTYLKTLARTSQQVLGQRLEKDK